MTNKRKRIKIRKAVIPVAGFGTRFLPITIAQPKEMLPIVDKPVIQYLVEEAVAAGIEEIIFVTGRNKRAIEDHFDYSGELEQLLRDTGKHDALREVHRISQLAKFVFVRQNRMLGNGHAVMMAREVIGDEPFAVLFGDDLLESKQPAIGQLIQTYRRTGTAVVGTFPVKQELVHRYGIVRPAGPVKTKSFRVTGIWEKPPAEKAPSNEAVLGRYILPPSIFHYLTKAKPTLSGEIYLTDAINLMTRREQMYACEVEARYWDCGNMAEFIKANIHFALRHKDMRRPIRDYLKKPY